MKKLNKKLDIGQDIKRLRTVLGNIKKRCRNGKNKNYGGKGIRNHLGLYELFYLWVRDGGWKLNKPSIDRRNFNKDYTISNCRFTEFDENRMNREFVYQAPNGFVSLTAASKKLGVTRQTIYTAIKRGILTRVEINKKPFVLTESLKFYSRYKRL